MLQTSEVNLTTKFEAMSPREISYWLALVFSQSPVIQQALLEVRPSPSAYCKVCSYLMLGLSYPACGLEMNGDIFLGTGEKLREAINP